MLRRVTISLDEQLAAEFDKLISDQLWAGSRRLPQHQ